MTAAASFKTSAACNTVGLLLLVVVVWLLAMHR
jgi:hypothetical protein